MKKLICLLLALLLPMTACAQTLVCGAEEGTTMADLAATLAELCGWDLTLDEDEATAANEMLSASGTVCLGTQLTQIRSLQGYTDKDLRDTMTPVLLCAQDDVWVVMQAEAAASLGIADLAQLRAWIEANEYAAIMMRPLDADVYDRAVCRLMDAFCLDQELFFDTDDMVAAMDASTPYVLLTGSASALALSAEGYTVLGCLSAERGAAFPELLCAAEADMPVCDGEQLLLMVKKGTKTTAILSAAKTAMADARWTEALAAAHLQSASVEGDALTAQVKAQFADYVDYMTAEGLFFYEEQ